MSTTQTTNDAPALEVDEGPSIDDLIRAAEILQLDPSELLGALAPLFVAEGVRRYGLTKRQLDTTDAEVAK